MIQRSISSETRCMIYFQKIASILIIHHKIKPQHLKTHIVSWLRWTTTPIISHQHRLSSNQRLNYLILYLTPVDIRSVSHFLQTLKKLSQRLLMSITHIVHWIVVLIVRIRLVYRVVSQMQKVIVQIFRLRQLVFFSSKTHQTLIIEIDLQWITSWKQNINS